MDINKLSNMFLMGYIIILIIAVNPFNLLYERELMLFFEISLPMPKIMFRDEGISL